MPAYLAATPCTGSIHCPCRECRMSSYTPSPAEIRRQCEAIRRTWGPTERLSRIADGATQRCVAERPTVPVVSLDPSEPVDALWRE